MYYEESSQRMELDLKRREVRARMGSGSPTFAIVAGLLFMGLGGSLALIGMKVLEVDPESLHVPHWVMIPFGLSWFWVGPLLIVRMIIMRSIERKTEPFEGDASPRGQSLADYPWDEAGYTPARWEQLIKLSYGLVFFGSFMAVFNFMEFFADYPILGWLDFTGVIWALDGLLLFGFLMVFLRFGRILKYRNSRVEFLSFPYQPTETIVLRWVPPKPLRNGKNASFTLRCVEEIWETTGEGKNRSTKIRQEEVWSGSWMMGSEEDLPSREAVDLSFNIPDDSPSTGFAYDEPTFWELEVKIEDAGFDFEEIHLVPIYSF